MWLGEDIRVLETLRAGANLAVGVVSSVLINQQHTGSGTNNALFNELVIHTEHFTTKS